MGIVHRVISSVAAALERRRFRVQWFESWSRCLDDVLVELPESVEGPSDLFRRLATSSSLARKRFAIVSERDAPVGLVALRAVGSRWEVIGGSGVAPRFVAPAREGYLLPTLGALGVEVHVPTQTWEPSGRYARRIYPLEIYRIDPRSDYEAYWRQSGNHGIVKQARKKTKGFSFEVDAPGSAEWTIRNWADFWRTEQTRCLEDHLVAASFFSAAGRFHSFRLLDGNTPVAGHVFYIDRENLLLLKTYTRPDYRATSAGTGLFDLVFDWASREPFAKLDFGVGGGYKRLWAPGDGMRWSFDVLPFRNYITSAVARRFRSMGSSLVGAARLSPSPANGDARPAI
jgi:hypothetical protein